MIQHRTDDTTKPESPMLGVRFAEFRAWPVAAVTRASCGTLALALALTVAGCAKDRILGFPTHTTPVTAQTGQPVPAGRIYQKELTAPSPGHTASVSFSRDKGMVGSASNLKVAVDGKPAFVLHAGEFQKLYLAPGVHLFTVGMKSWAYPGPKKGEFHTAHSVTSTFALGHATRLEEGGAETYRISWMVPDDCPQVETTEGAFPGYWSGLYGRVVDGRYSAPGGGVTFRAPGGETHFVDLLRDHYSMGLDRGYVERFDIMGTQAVHYAGLTALGIASPSDSNECRAALKKAWESFAMPDIFAADSRDIEVVYQERVVDQGKDMLLSIVRLPRASVSTTGKKLDSFPAALMRIDGGYAVLLRSQSHRVDSDKKSPKEIAADCLPGLLAQMSALEFTQ